MEKRKDPARPPRDAATHYGSTCGACKKGPIRGKLFLCLVCDAYDLCQPCFEHGAHPAHPFAVQAEPLGAAVDVDRVFPRTLTPEQPILTAPPEVDEGEGLERGVDPEVASTTGVAAQVQAQGPARRLVTGSLR